MVCGSSSSAVTTHGPIASGSPSAVRERVAAGAARRPVVHERVAEDRSRGTSSRRGVATSPAPGPRRPSARSRSRPRRRARGRPARARRSGARRPSASGISRDVGKSGGRIRACLTTCSAVSSSFEGGTGGVHHGPAAARHQGFQGGGEGRVPDRRRADRLPHPRGSLPVAGAPSGHRSRASSGSRSIRPPTCDFRLSTDELPVTSRLGADRGPWLSYGRHHQRVLRASSERGDAPMAEKFRVTYATMSADNEELQTQVRRGRRADEGRARQGVPVHRQRRGALDATRSTRSRRRSTATSSSGASPRPRRKDVDDAVAAAKAFQLEWDRMGWQERVEIMRNVADIMEDRLFDLAALMAYEVGKSRLEALGDVQETAELIRWNADEMDKHEGFRTPMSGMGAAGDYYDVLRPYGVWAVISPFNFPMALSGGPSSRRARRRQRGGAEAVEPGRADGLQALRVLPRRRRAAGRVPPGDRARRVRRRPPLEAPRRGRHHVHRLVPGGHGHLQALRDRGAEAGHLRDGREEPRDRHEERRPGQGDRRRAAVARSGSADRSARRARACSSSARSTTTSWAC